MRFASGRGGSRRGGEGVVFSATAAEVLGGCVFVEDEVSMKHSPSIP